MPEVTFYVLASNDEALRLLFVCKLIEKAYRSGSFCYVLTENDAQAQKLDDLLWIFRPGSFIPHQLYTGTMPELHNMILLGSRQPPDAWRKVIVNLSKHGPANIEQGERILEVLDANEEIKSAGRRRFRYYQQLGIQPASHDM